VDELIDKLDRKVVKHKTRLQERRGEAAKRDLSALATA
jgi:ribosome-associated translation inhibitor RaiA